MPDIQSGSMQAWSSAFAYRLRRKHGNSGCLTPDLDWTEQHRALRPPSQRSRRCPPVADLPTIVARGCPRCGGDLGAEHIDFGYGDYSCVQCGAAFDVVCRDENGRLKFDRPGYYIPPDQQQSAAGMKRRGGMYERREPRAVYENRRRRHN